MIIRRAGQRAAIVIAVSMAFGGSTASAQDVLSRAKDFYASASYEEALATLETLPDKTAASAPTEIAAFQMLCLVALGRTDQAKLKIEAIVRSDPQYHVSEAQASPRVRTLFETVRRPLLPGIVRELYAKGRSAFDRKDMPAALKEFDRVIALVDELGGQDQGLTDLRTLASGFRDFAKITLAAAAAAPPAASGTPGTSAPGAPPAPNPSSPVSPSSPPAPVSGAPVTRPTNDTTRAPAAPNAASSALRATEPPVYSIDDTDVKRPVAISQVFPQWHPETLIEQKIGFTGYLDLLIGEDGRVLSVALMKSIHPRYDAQLLDAASKWTFRPATRNGHPVRYRYTISVRLGVH